MKYLLRILCLMLVLCMLAPAALAVDPDFNPDTATVVDIGGGLETPELPLVDEPITLTVLYPRQTQHGDFDTMWFIDQVEKETGIRLKILPVESAGWSEKMNLAFASDDLPDLFFAGVTPSDCAKYGMAGKLIPLNDLLEEYAPNAIRLLSGVSNGYRNVTADDGNIYFMPAYNLTARDMIYRSGSINTAWIEKLGMEAPHTVEELYEVLKAIRDNDADGDGDPNNEIPLSFKFNMDSNADATTPILVAYGFVNHRHDVIDGQYVYVPMQDNYREYLRYMNRLWEEDLLDHEVFTQTADQLSAKEKNFIVAMVSSADAHSYLAVEEQKAAYSLIGPLTSEFNQTLYWPASFAEAAAGAGMFAVTSSCKDPVAAVKLLNYFYSDHCSTMTKCGPEAGQWGGEGGWSQVVAEDGTVSYSIAFDTSKYTGFWDFRCKNGLMNMPFVYASSQAAIVTGAEYYAHRVSEMIFDSGCYENRREGYPQGVAFTEDEQDTLAMYVLLDNQVSLWCAQFINGERDINDDAAWAEYLAMIESMDVETMIETRQAAYDRWAKN